MELFELCIGLQSLEPTDYLPELGSEVRIHARGANDEPLPGLALRETARGSEARSIGVTAADGSLVYRPTRLGPIEVRAAHPGRESGDAPIELVAVLEVQPARGGPGIAWWAVPIGMLLAGHGWYRARRAAAPPPLRPGPC